MRDMALSRMNEFTVATMDPHVEPADTFVMSLTAGWDEIPPEEGGRSIVPGDVVVLCVIRPEVPVVGPSGWTAAPDGRSFWKMIMSGETDPVFRSAEPVQWLVRGFAVSGAEVLPWTEG